ncbi:MAG: hypothetical protein D6712_02295 [Chloroflexi bacterium]|nr:MAG: hypothetical protein D6712_02295 [Chloroflexota bacterium]
MDGQYIFFVTVLATLLLIVYQRIEVKRRRLGLALLIIVGLLLRHNAFLKDLHSETLIGIGLGLFISFLFWLTIGRYNPVGSSDEIKVLGMDD